MVAEKNTPRPVLTGSGTPASEPDANGGPRLGDFADAGGLAFLRDYEPAVRGVVTAAAGWWLWCDGGIINRGKSENPSPYGGTWAWRLTHNGIPIDEGGGLLLPEELRPADDAGVSNNHTELYAIVRGLEAWRDKWARVADAPPPLNLGSDSDVTLKRLFTITPWTNCPAWLRERAFAVKMAVYERRDPGHGPGLRAVLLDGHPTADHLATGEGKRGRAVSRHQHWCHRRCDEEARGFWRTFRAEKASEVACLAA